MGFEPFGSLKTGRFNRFTDPTADFDSLRPAQRPNRSDRSGPIFNTQVILLVLKLKTNKLSKIQNLQITAKIKLKHITVVRALF